MILTVHDELLFEAPKEAADETAAAVRELMEGAVTAQRPAHGRRRRWRKLERSEGADRVSRARARRVDRYQLFLKLSHSAVIAACTWRRSRGGALAGAIGDDPFGDQLFEIGAQRDAAVAAKAGADPAGHGGRPRAIEIAGRARRGGKPVARRRGSGIARSSSSIRDDHARVDRRAIGGRQRLRLAIERASPTSRARGRAHERPAGRSARSPAPAARRRPRSAPRSTAARRGRPAAPAARRGSSATNRRARRSARAASRSCAPRRLPIALEPAAAHDQPRRRHGRGRLPPPSRRPRSPGRTAPGCSSCRAAASGSGLRAAAAAARSAAPGPHASDDRERQQDPDAPIATIADAML